VYNCPEVEQGLASFQTHRSHRWWQYILSTVIIKYRSVVSDVPLSWSPRC